MLNLAKAKIGGSLVRSHGHRVPLVSAFMARTSIAAFAANRNIIYCVAGLANPDAIACVIHSTNGGLDWTPTGTPIENRNKAPLFGYLEAEYASIPGNQQAYNNCITVSPQYGAHQTQKVVIGCRNGYFVSTDSAQTWNMVSADSS